MTGPGTTTGPARGNGRRSGSGPSVRHADAGQPQSGGGELGSGRQTVRAAEQGEETIVAGALEDSADEGPTVVEPGLVHADTE